MLLLVAVVIGVGAAWSLAGQLGVLLVFKGVRRSRRLAAAAAATFLRAFALVRRAVPLSDLPRVRGHLLVPPDGRLTLVRVWAVEGAHGMTATTRRIIIPTTIITSNSTSAAAAAAASATTVRRRCRQHGNFCEPSLRKPAHNRRRCRHVVRVAALLSTTGAEVVSCPAQTQPRLPLLPQTVPPPQRRHQSRRRKKEKKHRCCCCCCCGRFLKWRWEIPACCFHRCGFGPPPFA